MALIWFLAGLTLGSIAGGTLMAMLASNHDIRKAEDQRELQEAIERTQA